MKSGPSRRRTQIEDRLRAAEAAPMFGGGNGKVYGLVLMLLLLVFVMLNYQGRSLPALEAVFPPQQPLTTEQIAARLQGLKEAYGGALFDPPDGDDFNETPGYYRLLTSLYQTASDPAKTVPPFDRDLAMRDPNAQRGQRVRVTGYSGKGGGMRAQRLDKALLVPGGELTSVWRCVLTDAERENTSIVDVLDDPGTVDLDNDRFVAEAVFWRVVKFPVGQNREGREIFREAPYLLARSIARLPPDPNAGGGTTRVLMLGLLILFLGIVLFGIYRIISSHRTPNLRAAIRSASLRTPPGNPPAGPPAGGAGSNP